MVTMEDKIQALADFKGVDPSKIRPNKYDKNSFIVEDDEYQDEEYEVLTEDECYMAFEDYEKSLIDDLGLDSFTPEFQEYILENCINENFFEQVAEEEAEFYVDEMSPEEVLDLVHEDGYYTEITSVEDPAFDENYPDPMTVDAKSIYRDNILRQGMAEYFESIYGSGWAKEMRDTLKDEINWDAVIDAMYDWDNRETLWGQMDAWDGQTHELGKYGDEWIFAFRTN